jgi:hypothetical protein
MWASFKPAQSAPYRRHRPLEVAYLGGELFPSLRREGVIARPALVFGRAPLGLDQRLTSMRRRAG